MFKCSFWDFLEYYVFSLIHLLLKKTIVSYHESAFRIKITSHPMAYQIKKDFEIMTYSCILQNVPYNILLEGYKKPLRIYPNKTSQ